MGDSIHTDIVPYVIHSVYYREHEPRMNTDFEKLMNLINFFESGNLDIMTQEEYDNWDRCNKVKNYNQWPVRGWTLIDGCKRLGKRKRLLGDLWQKGKNKIYVVNVTDLPAAGVTDASICADDEESIKEFVKDFREFLPENFKIEDTDAVSMTC